jgi:hypothetical protein
VILLTQNRHYDLSHKKTTNNKKKKLFLALGWIKIFCNPIATWKICVKDKSMFTKFKVQSNLLKESPKLNINLQRQDKRDD